MLGSPKTSLIRLSIGSDSPIPGLSFDYKTLPREFPRHYVPSDLKFGWEDLAKLYDELKGRELRSREDMEQWLRDESELLRRRLRGEVAQEGPQHHPDRQPGVREGLPSIRPGAGAEAEAGQVRAGPGSSSTLRERPASQGLLPSHGPEQGQQRLPSRPENVELRSRTRS